MNDPAARELLDWFGFPRALPRVPVARVEVGFAAHQRDAEQLASELAATGRYDDLKVERVADRRGWLVLAADDGAGEATPE